MLTEIYWINFDSPGALGVMPRPRGGDWLEDEIAAMARSGVTAIVSLLEPAEEVELDLIQERAFCTAAGLDFLSMPIADRSIPTDRGVTTVLIDRVVGIMMSGGRVAIHCRQGIGRAALVACGVLVRVGYDAEAAMKLVGIARGREIPETEEQVQWVREWSRTVR